MWLIQMGSLVGAAARSIARSMISDGRNWPDA